MSQREQIDENSGYRQPYLNEKFIIAAVMNVNIVL